MNHNLLVAVHGLKLEIGNLGEIKIEIGLHLLFGKNTDQSKIVFIRGRFFFYELFMRNAD